MSATCYHDRTVTVQTRSLRDDLMVLTKARLSLLVVVTTFFGFWLRARGAADLAVLVHTLVGTSLAALGSSVFNQLMEIEPDSRMDRTRERPLPARRMAPGVAFGIGWVLSAFSLIHLARFVNVEAAMLTAATLAIYIFVYTPLKQRSSLNTIVGAVAGALPPLIGWVAASGPSSADRFFRWNLLVEPGALFLFGLLFFWQLPHFLAINWMYREQYVQGGFRMWSNDDASGARTGGLAVLFSVCLLAVMAIPAAAGDAGRWFLPLAGILSAAMILLSIRFVRQRTRPAARTLFLYTLVYLPALLGVALATWKTT